MGRLPYDYQKSHGQSKGHGFLFDCLRVTGTIFDCSLCAGILTLHRGGYSVGLGFWLVCWGGGRRWKVRDSWAGAGGQPAITPRVFTVLDERGGVSRPQDATRPSRRDGSTTQLPPLCGQGSPKEATVESEPGARRPLASPALEGPVYSRAMRIALTRTRRVNGASSRPVSQAYMLLRVDGPSIT